MHVIHTVNSNKYSVFAGDTVLLGLWTLFVSSYLEKKNMVFQILDRFLSSGERVGRQFLSWA